MVAKKRSTLRNKVAVRSGLSEKAFDNITLPVDLELPPDPKAFLHQARESKKDKQTNKQQTFLSQIKEKALVIDSNFAGISKSSIRRRKRKQRDDLKPKMHDLLTSLQQEEDLKEDTKDLEDPDKYSVSTVKVTKIIKSENYQKLEVNGPGFIKIKRNDPNIRNQKGAKRLALNESKRFNQVLNNPSFQSDPFGSLREIIKIQKH